MIIKREGQREREAQTLRFNYHGSGNQSHYISLRGNQSRHALLHGNQSRHASLEGNQPNRATHVRLDFDAPLFQSWRPVCDVISVSNKVEKHLSFQTEGGRERERRERSRLTEKRAKHTERETETNARKETVFESHLRYLCKHNQCSLFFIILSKLTSSLSYISLFMFFSVSFSLSCYILAIILLMFSCLFYITHYTPILSSIIWFTLS